MAEVIARIKVDGKHFEILVDVDKALAFKKGENISMGEILGIDKVFSDSKKGEHASNNDLKSAFKTEDINEIAAQIIKKGEVQIPVEYKHKELGERAKQIVAFLTKNAVDPRSGRPYTDERIESAMKEAGVNITNKPIESQLKDIIEKLNPIIPIKVETKRLKITIPAQYAGQSYGIINPYKEKEDWQDNGDLVVFVNMPVGLQMDFYDKLNSVTHGSAVSEEIKEKE